MATSKTALRAMVVFLIAGIAKQLQNVTQVAFKGNTYTPAQLTQLLQSWVDLYDEVTVARTTYEAKLQAFTEQQPPLLAIIKGFRAYLQLHYSQEPTVLSAFGETPTKAPSPLTPAEMVAKAAQGKATRAARHTMGPKAKLKIKGVVAVPAKSEPAEATSLVVSTAPNPTKP